MAMTRSRFTRLGSAATVSMALRPFADAAATDDADRFHVALLADSHIIDDY
jgi:hypothetical protein